MLNISNIQHFSVGDGEGIRTTVFFKGCNLRCPWCHNPENLESEPAILCYNNGKTEVRGEKVTVEQILPELLEDKDFYDGSRGGVTFSGGEVMLCTEEAAVLAKVLNENGVSVLIDTAGCVPYEKFRALNPYVSGYLFDFKTADEEKYKSIGGNLSLVTENIEKLKKDGVPVHIRIPVIPGFNSDKDSSERICRYLEQIGIESVHLLPFHRLGKSKYEAMNLEYKYADVLPFAKEEICAIESIYSQYFKLER